MLWLWFQVCKTEGLCVSSSGAPLGTVLSLFIFSVHFSTSQTLSSAEIGVSKMDKKLSTERWTTLWHAVNICSSITASDLKRLWKSDKEHWFCSGEWNHWIWWCKEGFLHKIKKAMDNPEHSLYETVIRQQCLF